MNIYYQAIDYNGIERCGSSYAGFINDLKTVKGVTRRLKTYMFPQDVERIKVYSFTDVFDDETYTLIKEITRQ